MDGWNFSLRATIYMFVCISLLIIAMIFACLRHIICPRSKICMCVSGLLYGLLVVFFITAGVLAIAIGLDDYVPEHCKQAELGQFDDMDLVSRHIFK